MLFKRAYIKFCFLDSKYLFLFYLKEPYIAKGTFIEPLYTLINRI